LFVRLDVVTAKTTKFVVFRDVTSCSWIEVYYRCSGACCLHCQGA